MGIIGEWYRARRQRRYNNAARLRLARALAAMRARDTFDERERADCARWGVPVKGGQHGR